MLLDCSAQTLGCRDLQQPGRQTPAGPPSLCGLSQHGCRRDATAADVRAHASTGVWAWRRLQGCVHAVARAQARPAAWPGACMSGEGPHLSIAVQLLERQQQVVPDCVPTCTPLALEQPWQPEESSRDSRAVKLAADNQHHKRAHCRAAHPSIALRCCTGCPPVRKRLVLSMSLSCSSTCSAAGVCGRAWSGDALLAAARQRGRGPGSSSLL